MNEKDFEVIRWHLNKTGDPKWKQLGERHFSLIPPLFTLARKDERYYFTILLHLNCVFEGGLKIFGESKGLAANQIGSLQGIINGLRERGMITSSVKVRLEDFKNYYRNRYTHEVFLKPSEKDAIEAVTETYFLTLVLIYLYSIPRAIGDNELDKAIVRSFCESFGFYINIQELSAKKGYHLIPVPIKELRRRLTEVHRNSIFSRIFSLNLERSRGLGFPFELQFIRGTSWTGAKWRLRVQKFVDLPTDHAGIWESDLRQNTFYLLFRSTGRSRVEGYLKDLESYSIPYLVVDLRPKRRRLIAEEDSTGYLVYLDRWMR